MVTASFLAQTSTRCGIWDAQTEQQSGASLQGIRNHVKSGSESHNEEDADCEPADTVPSSTAIPVSLPRWAKSIHAASVDGPSETRTRTREKLALLPDVEVTLIGILYPDGSLVEDLVWADMYRKYMLEGEKHAPVQVDHEWARTRGIAVQRRRS